MSGATATASAGISGRCFGYTNLMKSRTNLTLVPTASDSDGDFEVLMELYFPS